METLKITTCTVTKNNGKIIYYSIKSIVKYVDEILIFDDSKPFNANYHLQKLENKYGNVKILKKDLGKDLGKKKQYLVDMSRNEIVMRWDDDFVLFDFQCLKNMYQKLNNNLCDYIVSKYEHNIYFDMYHVNAQIPYCKEAYLYKKYCFSFGEANGYSDYPIITRRDYKYLYNHDTIFIHLSNIKTVENQYYRTNMSQFMIQDRYNNYDEYLFNISQNTEYDFNDIINFRKKQLKIIQNSTFSKKNMRKIETLVKNIDISSINPKLINYVSSNYLLEYQTEQTEQTENKNKFKYVRPLTYMNLRLFYWGGKYKIGNFGDYLSYYIFEKITGFPPEFYSYLDSNSNNNEEHYLSVGSILKYSNEQSIIWGSGFIHSKSKINNFKQITCVRGPKTRNKLGNDKCPEKYGDPALLLPFFFKQSQNKKYKLGIIPHIIDYEKIIKLYENIPYIKIIDLKCTRESIQDIIREILQCERVISSSLHGIIVSHAYNIPCVWIKGQQLAGDDFKFDDYYSSVYDDKISTYHNKFRRKNSLFKIDFDNFEKYFVGYENPTKIKNRQIDLIQTCPFLDNTKLLLDMVDKIK